MGRVRKTEGGKARPSRLRCGYKVYREVRRRLEEARKGVAASGSDGGFWAALTGRADAFGELAAWMEKEFGFGSMDVEEV